MGIQALLKIMVLQIWYVRYGILKRAVMRIEAIISHIFIAHRVAEGVLKKRIKEELISTKVI